MHGILVDHNRKLTGPDHESVSKGRVTGLARGTLNAIFTSGGRWLKCSCLYIILNMNTVRPIPELKKYLPGFLPERCRMYDRVLCRRYYLSYMYIVLGSPYFDFASDFRTQFASDLSFISN
jgi:hypothetical protein